MEPITISLGTLVTLSKCLGYYLGFIENSANNTKKLVHAPLQCAISCLEDAVRCTDNIQRFQLLLQDAERNFRNAVPLEENELKVNSLLGLSICQLLLNDKKNASNSLRNLTEVQLIESEGNRLVNRGIAQVVLTAINPFSSKSDEIFDEKLEGLFKKRYNILEFHKEMAVEVMKNIIHLLASQKHDSCMKNDSISIRKFNSEES